jgi:transposase
VDLVVMEATGGYETLAASALAGGGLRLAVVNPRQVRDFARSRNVHAKTDLLDARILAAFAEANAPAIVFKRSQNQLELDELIQRRRQLVEMRTMEINRQAQATLKLPRQQIQKLLGIIEKQIHQLDKQIAEKIDGDGDLKKTSQVLLSVPGIGPTTSAMLIAELPELGTMNRQKIAALVGVAPYDRQSGQWRGRSMIYGGRESVRTSLYMATLVAMKHNPTIRLFAQRLKAAGKAAKLVIIASMRKLLTILNVMVKTGETWNVEKKPSTP